MSTETLKNECDELNKEYYELEDFLLGENCVIGAQELENVYKTLENSIPELQWQSPGREMVEEQTKGIENTVAEKEQLPGETHEPAKNDFDFNDFDGPTSITRGKTPKSAKKKTANFADVLKKSKELQHNFK